MSTIEYGGSGSGHNSAPLPIGLPPSDSSHGHHSHSNSNSNINTNNPTITIVEGRTLTAKPHAFAGAVLSPKHARELTPSLCLAIASGLADQSYRKKAVPYTLWITEAWRVLGWGEPSAALFWEMATMYHTLYLAGRAYATDFHETSNIPPILSCGSTSSMGSGNTHYTMGGGTTGGTTSMDKKKLSAVSTSASAKELPVWLVATFLLMHCEEKAYQRNLSALENRQMNATFLSDPLLNLLKYPGLSPRAHLNAGWHNDNSHCTAYLLRHLRKLLLLAAVSHNPDAVRSIMHLAAIPTPSPGPITEKFRKQYMMGGAAGYNTRYSADELRRQHDEEHGNVGLSVRLSMEDLERLHFWLQPPSGGGVDDSPLKIGEYLWASLYSSPPPPTATIPIGDVEREVRRHLELELLMAGVEIDDKEEVSTDEEETAVSTAFSQLSLTESNSGDDGERAKQPPLGNKKEINYTQLRGTTILLKPNTSSPPSDVHGTASVTSGDHHQSSSRLHDLAISDCSDVHMYLLQPFENVTIAACTDCTFVVGAVAGLVHVVDCERTQITTAARRILLSNSCDTVMNIFTPTPPLLVGDNRSCQFAPYNTYYEGLREDLLATGLAAAAAVPAESQSPFHGSVSSGLNQVQQAGDGPWPPVQCASNKWKYPIEISKLEIPQVAGSSTGASSSASSPSQPNSGNHNGNNNAGSNSLGADDKRTSNAGTIGDSSVPAPILMPASEFHVMFVPIESESSKQRRLEAEASLLADQQQDPASSEGDSKESSSSTSTPTESKYCRALAEVLQFSPFRLPAEYERRALVKADRMRSIQQAVRKKLPEDKQKQFQEELNRGFRDWLVTSGNLRQVLDLVHLERRGGV